MAKVTVGRLEGQIARMPDTTSAKLPSVLALGRARRSFANCRPRLALVRVRLSTDRSPSY